MYNLDELDKGAIHISNWVEQGEVRFFFLCMGIFFVCVCMATCVNSHGSVRSSGTGIMDDWKLNLGPPQKQMLLTAELAPSSPHSILFVCLISSTLQI